MEKRNEMADIIKLLPPNFPLHIIPFGRNPSGAPPDFDSSVSLWSTITGVCVVFTVFATSAVSIRFWENVVIKKTSGLDDVFCFAAWLLTVGYAGLQISSSHYHHSWDTPLSVIASSDYVKRTFASGLLWGPTIWCVKCAILALFYRVFGLVRRFRIALYICLALITVIHLSSIPFFAIACTPRPREHWNLTLLASRCYPAQTHMLMHSVGSTITDIYIILLPIPEVLNLQVDLRRKIALCVTFSLGVFALFASALGIYYRVLIYRLEDVTWNTGRAVMVIIVELCIGIMVSCCPAVVSAWKRVVVPSTFYSRGQSALPSLWRTSWKSKRTGTSSGGNSRSRPVSMRPKQDGAYVELTERKNDYPRLAV